MDTTKVNVSLTTAGDYALHRLLVVLLRYCLKASRLDFENSGMQTPSFSQQPPILVDEAQMIWQTSFIMTAISTDYWINQEFITNDSGPLHVAVAYTTPTISFFGPETPIIYGPKFHADLHKVFFLNLYCSPCISVFRDKNFICENKNNCMFQIQPENVIEIVEKFLIHKKF